MFARLKAWYDQRRGGRAVVVTWIVTRALILAIFELFERFVVGDVTYYFRKIDAMFDVGLAKTLNEYPTPVAWILTIPYGAGFGTRTGYVIGFIAFMMLLDAAFTFMLWRMNGREHDRAIDFWILFVFLVGPLSYLRFDILPAVLAGGALLAARRIPWVTGALTGLGAAIKLWPALLIPAFLSHKSDRKVAAATFAGVGVGLAVLSLLLGGWARLISPLTWQSGRGLQIESIWATPLMIARAIAPTRWVVDISKFQAYEIFGSGVSTMLVVSNIATVVGLVGIVALYVRAYRSGAPSAVGVGLVILATVAIMTITNKTLSPQYLLWLGGPMAALLVLKKAQTSMEERLLIRRLARQLLLLAVLTHLVYPAFYDGLLGRLGHGMIIAATAITALRNIALLLFTFEVIRMAWRDLRRQPDPGISQPVGVGS